MDYIGIVYTVVLLLSLGIVACRNHRARTGRGDAAETGREPTDFDDCDE